jgi:outer membrane protein assembly factor BamB
MTEKRRTPRRRAARPAGRLVFATCVVSCLALLALGLSWFASFAPIRDAEAGPFSRAHVPGLGRHLSAAVREPSWPMFGGTPMRARFVPSNLGPPFRLLYVIRGGGLIEMPPAISERRVVFGTHEGDVIATRVDDGRRLWRTNVNGCIASSPAVWNGVVYVGWAGTGSCRRGKDEHGGVVALGLESGDVLWRFHTGNVEASPAVVDGMLFFSAFRNRSAATVYAMKLGEGRRIAWSAHLPSKVASSPALLGRRLYISAYDRYLYSFDGWSGRFRWRTTAFSQDAEDRFLLDVRSLVGRGSWTEGGYYATPAVAYGRVYAGVIDGVFSAFDAHSGAHRWSQRLGGSIYASAAIWQEKVYVGTTEGRFFALSARDGRVLWNRDLGGKILGSATVTGSRVYVATTERRTFVLDARTGETDWIFGDGHYSPFVLSGSRGFLVGKGRVYAVANAFSHHD